MKRFLGFIEPCVVSHQQGGIVKIRTFQPGDEQAQLKLYNSSAAAFPKFKPAMLMEIQRRVQARDFDAGTRFYAEDRSEIVAYCTFQPNGRVSFPWHSPGHQADADQLFAHVLQVMKQRGMPTAFACYRKDWPTINQYFETRGFKMAREMVNYLLHFENMPTPSSKLGSTVTAATDDDFPAIFALDPSVFRVPSAEALKQAIWKNPYIERRSVFVLRNRGDGSPIAAGMFIIDPTYADPRVLDADMPCFRLGAFGTEGMTTKRVKGLFSFVTKPERNLFSVGMDMLGHAANLLRDEDEIMCYTAQVASDATALHSFYQRVFERQGSFPVYEMALA